MLAQRLGNSISNLPTANDSFSLVFTGTEYLTLDEAAAEFSATRGTVSFWTKVDTMSSSGTVFRLAVDSNNYVQCLYHAGSNEMRFAYKGGGANRNAVITDAIENDGDWHHIMGTWDTAADEIKIYLDGTLKDTTTGLGTFAGTAALFDIGQNTAAGNYYKGYVDEFSLFDTVKAIGDVYIATREPINVTGVGGLAGYWKIEAGSGTTLYDSSAKDNNGSLVNTPAWKTDTPF